MIQFPEDPELPEEQQQGSGDEGGEGHQGTGDEPDEDDEGGELSLEGESDDEGGGEISAATAALLGDKLYFKIGEVARIVGVKPYVLRYWETEFSILRPGKTRSKHRLYRRRDVDLLLKIKDLLHTRRFTIEGARKKLREESATTDAPSAATGALAEIREALVRIRDSLA